MNNKYISYGDKTYLYSNEGTKEITTTDNLYDTLTQENVVEHIDNLILEENNDSIMLKNMKTKLKNKKILFLALLGCGVTLNLVQVFSLFVLTKSITDILFFCLVIACNLFLVNHLENCFEVEKSLAVMETQHNLNLAFLNRKKDQALKLLEEIKSNSQKISIQNDFMHELNNHPLEHIDDQFKIFNSYSNRSLKAMDEPNWQNHPCELNNEDVETVKLARIKH